jgi:hypothetical protein
MQNENSNLPSVISPTTKDLHVCNRCTSIGFEPSLEPDKCTFCDGTFGGIPSEPFEKELEAAGHVLKREEDGSIDQWVLDYEHHNGPGCINCDQSWCSHCYNEIKPCPGREAVEAERKAYRYEQYLKLKAEFENAEN